MNADILYKIILFWVIFFITPGPVWVSVMEATRKMSAAEIGEFFFKVFFPSSLLIQCSQAIICVFFVGFVITVFSKIDFVFYLLGGLYIAYLAYKAIKSKQSNVLFKLGFVNLAMVMLLSPKIWLLFPSGAVIANQFSHSDVTNALVFSGTMLVVQSVMFFVYAFIGKVGTTLLKDNFSYLASALLVLFALFLFNEAFYIAIENS
jgi:threonine/homoserine/homoserine lactone efflux protein